MKHFIASAWLLAAMIPASAYAQQVDRSKYPDYSTAFYPDYSLLNAGGNESRHTLGTEQSPLPDHVDNSKLRFFPPVFAQDGGSCGSASRICYMFTHELNAYRNRDARSLANRYPSHFVWLLTNGNSGKDEFVQNIGVPSAELYGGTTYSHLFGAQIETQSDFGWMQGYDKWYSAMFNRMLAPAHFPASLGTPKGREALKRWLYNHNGDTSFYGGGIAGIGVASGGDFQPLPGSPQNDAFGFTGKYYVKRWGTQVDHAMTIVGYDDRIEFDLNGNGIMGEASADERGAWIMVNSWGNMWCNQGFVYCPYAYAGSRFNQSGQSFQFSGDWWYPEIYKVRKDYRPLRTIKLKMDYSHRSELHLSAGVSTDLNATYPEQVVAFDHFKYAGDGNYGNSNPAPAVPMLGKWADGKLHDEPMEFGYDLTDLSSQFDKNQPLKYFFIIDTRSWGQGTGNIHSASIMDYENDLEGVETPFNLEGGKLKIESKGKKTIISTIVYGRGLYAPQNLALHEGKLSWQSPIRSHYQVANYRIYCNGTLLAEVPANETSFTLTSEEDNATYSVSAKYSNKEESAKVSVTTPIKNKVVNQVANVNHSGFSIPNIFRNKLEEATIEYWINPSSLSNWNQSAGPGWGQFMFHANANGSFTVGWDPNGNRIETTGGKLRTGQWNHVAITVKKNVMTLYINGTNNGKLTSERYSGIGGFGNLTWRSNGSYDDNHAKYDEIRIWNYARTAEQIKANKDVQYGGSLMPQGLIANYKGEVMTIDGKKYLRDCIGGNHAEGLNTQINQMPYPSLKLTAPTEALSASIVPPTGTVYVGIPAKLSAKISESVSALTWTAEGAGVKDLHNLTPNLTFTQAGEQKVTLTAVNEAGEKVTDSLLLQVQAAPEGDASFEPIRKVIPAGEHITFLVNNPILGYTYEWDMPGAEVEKVYTMNAAATYQHKGTYTVTLTVTSPDGKKKQASQQIQVTEVPPVAAFAITPAVILKGETTFLKDQSKSGPTSWNWMLSSPKASYLIKGQNSSFSPKQAGVYDATLTVSNSAGENSFSQPRALIVCNADSKNGLNFTSYGQEVKLERVPFDNNMQAFTIDWWMNPTQLTNYCCGVGDNMNWMIKADQEGNYSITKGKDDLCKVPKMVKENEWHHYAVVYNGQKVSFYRDGEIIQENNLQPGALSQLKNFSVSLNDAPMFGQIDEFRVWNTALTTEKLQHYANQPIAEGTADAADRLAVYFDFNQNGGNVIDRSGNKNNGQRLNFGPDGDAWVVTKGVFSLNFQANGQSEDVSETYLRNYRAPYTYDPNTPISPFSKRRFMKITDWTLENAVESKNGVITTVHVDREKNDQFTCTTTWDNFYPTLTDHKAYQTIKLPAGMYTFVANYDEKYEGECENSYLVVAKGKGLPDTNRLSEALNATLMSPKSATMSNKLEFLLQEETEVSLGLVINMTNKKCMVIHDFQLLSKKAEELEADGSYGYNLQMGLDGMKTLALPYPTLIPEGVKAFAATEVKDNQVILNEIEEGIVPAHTGVVVEAAAGEYHFEPSVEAGRTKSLLLSVTEPTATDNALKYYELTVTPKAGFTLFNSLELEKNRAYLTRPATESQTFFPFQLIYTGIGNVTTPSKAVPTYDLSGRRVKNPTRGVYITEGKKVWIK